MINEIDKAYNEALNLFSENNTITKDTVVNGKSIHEMRFHEHDPFHVYEQLRAFGLVAKTGDNVYEITSLGRGINIQGGWIAYRKSIEEDKGLSEEVKRSIKISNYIHAVSIVVTLGVLLYVTFVKNDSGALKELMEVNEQMHLKDIEYHKEMLMYNDSLIKRKDLLIKELIELQKAQLK